jgi:hypothetical protein
MKNREYLSTLFNGYRDNGHVVFVVTLTAFVKSDSFAKSSKMSDFWEYVFIRRIQKHLPYKLKTKFDHRFVIELSPKGKYHYHGLIAAPKEVADKIYSNGRLNRHISRDLVRLNNEGKYRTHKIKKFEIEPATNINRWVNYITKTYDYIYEGVIN